MTLHEKVGLSIFLLLFVLVPIVLAIRVLYCAFGRREWCWTDRYWVGLFCVQILCVLYGWLFEPTWIEHTHHKYVTSRSNPGWQAKAVHLTDLHFDGSAGDEIRARLARDAIADYKPDFIMITGDYVTHPHGVPLLEGFVKKLHDIAPVYGVKGNWEELITDSMREAVDKCGITFIDGRLTQVNVRGKIVTLAGIPLLDSGEDLKQRLQQTDPEFAIALNHFPHIMPVAARAGFDLFFCGHTHGGQVRLPWYGAIVTFSGAGKQYEAGTYQLGSTTAYISRGLGMEGGKAPRVRFLCRPEILFLHIEGGI